MSESHLIQDIYYARHRLDLMFRVAHINRDKTRLLFRNLEPSDVAEGTVRPQRYNPNQIVNRNVSNNYYRYYYKRLWLIRQN